ncbi:putative aliphatic sulfonates transport permease protein SsuC [Clostridium acetireducens DSM 10703]|jgi:sulfonate transport system permease protein|uniref:Putative aliphatic sulfonates transport permease protein SsuC n=1 Tax=Clostridium acetireducens DSM 10703 TaxID=1121290 RepID=A0A1E8EZ45_9CLOT|nr:ABC transporter permease [Clostridium acetireducens]OFI05956.1 putative aliphatic sulfonates transport permease protein SsuC [Clostridium acetireducens DSM 10703]
MICKLKGSIPIILIFVLWYLGGVYNWWSAYILPPPKVVVVSAYNLILSGVLFKHIYDSLVRILWGFFITLILAIPLGILFGINKKIYEYFEPILEFIRHTPPLALIPMLILWFGIGEKSKVIIIILASFFPVLLNTMEGVESCDNKLIEVGKIFNLSTIQVFFKIIIPSALPNILLGMKLGIGYSWRAIIGAEMVAASSGLGYLILDGQQLSRSDVVMVGILFIGFLGIITDALFSFFIKKIDICNVEVYKDERI